MVFTKNTYTWSLGSPSVAGFWVKGNRVGNAFTSMVFRDSGGFGNAYVDVALHSVNSGEIALLDSSTSVSGTGDYSSSPFLSPHLTFTNGRWVGFWPHFTSTDDATAYWLGVWYEEGGNLIFERNETVVVPFAHTSGTTTYGWVLGVLDDCVIINNAQIVGSDHHFYSRVVPVGAVSDALASVTDTILTGVGAGDPSYPANWVPESVDSIRVYWNTYSGSPPSFVLGKDGSVSQQAGASSGWWYSSPFIYGRHDVISGEYHVSVVESSTRKWKRLAASGAVLDEANTYANYAGNNVSQYSMEEFRSQFWSSEWRYASGSYPTGFHGVITQDVYGDTPTRYLQPTNLSGAPNNMTQLFVARTSMHLLAVGFDFSTDIAHYWNYGFVENITAAPGSGRIRFGVSG